MKFLYSFFILLFISLFTSAQCIPDTGITHNDPGIYPDSATGLPHAVPGVAYSTDIQVKVLTDSTVGLFHAIVDSIVLNNVAGLPPGFTYSCTPSSCSFPGGSNACILLQSPPPSSGMAGVYPLEVQTTIYFKISGTPQTLADNNNDYSIVIDSTTGISTVDRSLFSVGQSIPNPAKDNVIIPLNLIRPDEINLKIVNVIGKKIYSRNYSLPKGKTNLSVDVHGFPPGIYLYIVSGGLNSIAKRMIISND